jgi:hypothetical protein
MTAFQIIVILVATLILILIYIGVWWLITKTQSQGTIYPPIVNQCPDGWLTDSSSNCIVPNSFNLGNLSAFNSTTIPGYFLNPVTNQNEMSILDTAWAGYSVGTPVCNKKLWSNVHNVFWDGISNSNQC